MCIWLTANLASILQVSTSDGRIKIIGHEGVEKTIRAADHTGTRHIQFLVNKGAVLRVTEVQVRDCSQRPLLASLRLRIWDASKRNICLALSHAASIKHSNIPDLTADW